MAELEPWMAATLAIGTPLLAFAGTMVGSWVSRKGDQETETRSKREETMRNLRWAAELAASDDDRQSALGVSQLTALASADMLDPEQEVFVEAALDSLLSGPESAIEELGEGVVVEVSGSGAGHTEWTGTAVGEAPAVESGDEDGGAADG